MIRLPPDSHRLEPLFPYPTPFRSFTRRKFVSEGRVQRLRRQALAPGYDRHDRLPRFVGMLGTHRIDEFPDDAAVPGDLEDPPARRLGDQGVAVRQALLRPARLAFEGMLEAAGVAPDAAAVVGVDLQDAEIGRAHV